MTNSYRYNRNRLMSDSEIYQAQVARAEELAELTAQQVEVNGGERKPVYYFKYVHGEEITTRCRKCAEEDEAELEEIDLAGLYDDCAVCGAQNV